MLNCSYTVNCTAKFNIQNYKFNIPLNSLFDCPYEGAEAELGSLGIELA